MLFRSFTEIFVDAGDVKVTAESDHDKSLVAAYKTFGVSREVAITWIATFEVSAVLRF